MSAILSADDLNDFISPGVACIKPVETLPKQEDYNPYEVTTEDKVQAQNPAPASISLTDCLACSGCVTSAEAVLVSLQSHNEVLNTLDAFPSIDLSHSAAVQNGATTNHIPIAPDTKLFIASVSPQVRASIAATFGISDRRAGYMIEQFLSGSQGLRLGGKHNADFSYVVDTNRMREACLVLSADELAASIASSSKSKPVLTSACPGWICYAEKTHPHILPHLSALKSPQALTGTILKSVLSKAFSIHPSQIWHLSIMPCFDKKLEASREELTDKHWSPLNSDTSPVRDVDCVITSRELITLAEARGVKLSSLPLKPVRRADHLPFPDPIISRFLFPSITQTSIPIQSSEAGTSGGYLHHILLTQQSLHPSSEIITQRGRNADVIEYTLTSPTNPTTPILKCARYYGFRNIQNLVRKLKPAKQSRLPGAALSRRLNSSSNPNSGPATDYSYIEVMACPGGCTNGGGQIKIEDVAAILPETRGEIINAVDMVGERGVKSQKEWLARVDEAYFSLDSDDDNDIESDDNVIHENGNINTNGEINNKEIINGINITSIHEILNHWSSTVEVPLEKLAYTTFRQVESDVGKKKSVVKKMGDSERIAAIAGLQGGGW